MLGVSFSQNNFYLAAKTMKFSKIFAIPFLCLALIGCGNSEEAAAKKQAETRAKLKADVLEITNKLINDKLSEPSAQKAIAEVGIELKANVTDVSLVNEAGNKYQAINTVMFNSTKQQVSSTVIADGSAVHVEIDRPSFHTAIKEVVEIEVTKAMNAQKPSAQEAPEAAPVSRSEVDNSQKYADTKAMLDAAEKEINSVWKALPSEVRKKELDNQRAFNKSKEEECFKIATQAGDGEEFEYAKNMCWLQRYQKRIPELKSIGMGGASATLSFSKVQLA